MTSPPAEVTISTAQVHQLLSEQCPQWAQLPLSLLGEGWDNVMYRLGHDLVVRLPRRELAVACLRTEHRWLGALSADLPTPVPVPIHHGRPGADYPWPWSVVPHLPGRPQAAALDLDQSVMAVQLADFFIGWHRPAPAELEASPVRGVPLARRGVSFTDWVAALPERWVRADAEQLWAGSLAARPHRGPDLVLHGDPHPLNLLVSEAPAQTARAVAPTDQNPPPTQPSNPAPGPGARSSSTDRSTPAVGCTLSAVIDFGDLTRGDPACDLGIATLGLRPRERELFRARIDSHRDPSTDPDLWLRADGWALYEAVIFAVTAEPDSLEAQIAERSLTTLGVRAHSVG